MLCVGASPGPEGPFGEPNARKRDDMDILIIEDDNDVAEYVEEVVLNTASLENATMARAASGDKGLDLIQSVPFDLVILDIMIPVYDGITVLQSFRQVNTTTPVIVISGYFDTEKLVQLRQLGVHTALFKPIAAEAMQKAIAQAIGISVQ